jgi:polyhydroxyalkanoate synthesis regulator phasin
MADEPPNLVLEMLRDIREEQTVTSMKIGTLAEALVSMNRRVDDLGTRIGALEKRIGNLENKIDIIAIAVDQHTLRLESIEARLGLGVPTH